MVDATIPIPPDKAPKNSDPAYKNPLVPPMEKGESLPGRSTMNGGKFAYSMMERQHKTTLKKQGYAAHAAALAFITGAAWTRERRQQHGLLAEATCPRCNAEVETEHHRCYRLVH